MKFQFLVSLFVTNLTLGVAICADPPARPTELKELDRLVGTWKVAEFVAKKAEWTPEEVRTSGDVATTKWIMDGWFLEDRKSPANGSDHLGIWHYDQGEKAFHYTMFQVPGGNRADFTIHWNAKTQAFEGTAPHPNGVTMRTTSRFPNKDTKEWSAIATDAAGKVYLDIRCKEVRADKALPDQQASDGAYVDEAATSLQGLWKAQSLENNGEMAADKEVKQVWIDFNANKVVLKIDSPDAVTCSFKTNPKESPKQIDIFLPEKNKPLLAIYEVSVDELKICWHGSDVNKRPTEFAAKEKSGQMLIVLKKQKP